jgi:hypothetical protein
MDNSGGIAYRGKRYTVTAPNTLDLAHHAELGLNGIGGTIDPDLDYHMYFSIFLSAKTPWMKHHAADSTCDPKYAESFPMLRLMCGSSQYEDIEAGQRLALLNRIEEGLYWNKVDSRRPWRAAYNAAFDRAAREEDVANVGANGRMLRALLTWRELENDPAWDGHIRSLIRGLRGIAVDRDGYSYFPDGGYGEPFNYPRSGWLNTTEAGGEVEGGEGSVVAYQGHPIQALARWYCLSGDDEALDFAGRITRYVMLPRFWGGLPAEETDSNRVGHVSGRLPDAQCVAGDEQGHWYSHFHARAIALRGILEYGIQAHDMRVVEFVRRSYEYTLTFGIPRMGWVNTYPAAVNMMEGCALGDLVALAIRLTDARAGDYWDDVDAIVRNQLVEGQLTNAESLQRIAEHSVDISEERQNEFAAMPKHQYLIDRVIERSLGTFAGNSLPTCIPTPWVMQCCTGNATQGLYYAWEAAVREWEETAQVNLLLNRAARLVDVDSYLPYEGKVIVRSKAAQAVSIRIPSWVNKRLLRAQHNDLDIRHDWVGTYIHCRGLRPGDAVTLTFPIGETSANYTVNSRTGLQETYRCVFRGGTLVDVSPRDESPRNYQLYLRTHLRSDQTPMVSTKRFVADSSILKW